MEWKPATRLIAGTVLTVSLLALAIAAVAGGLKVSRSESTESAISTIPSTSSLPDELPSSIEASGPQLVWEENFDQFRPAYWQKEHSAFGHGNDELQCYRPRNVEVLDGNLVLRAVREVYACPQGSVREYTSGMVRSTGVTFQPGQRIEFRVKVDPVSAEDQRGLWPALWASNWNGNGWPVGGELDWLEYVGTTPFDSHHSIHFADGAGEHQSIPKAVARPDRFSNDWHTVTFDWTTDLVWYVDGLEVQRISVDSVDALGDPFGQPAAPITELRINFALGGNWPGPVGNTAVDEFGTTAFLVDYVRIFDLPS